MYDVGSVILIKHIIFKSTNGEKKCSIDHSYNVGRPCLVFHEELDKIYILQINSDKGKNYAHQISLMSVNSKKKSCVNVRDIHCKNIAFYKELFRITDLELYDILIKFVNYQENIRKDDLYDQISDKIKEKIDILRKTLQQPNGKSKKK